MTPFNILDRNLDIHRHYLLEASAGTGKTFSIENIVVRLLLETPAKEGAEPLTLDKILVVTFTRAATRDLKTRIRANIERALSFFEEACQEPDAIPSERWPAAPDYLLSHLESGIEAIKQGRKRLEQALACFDQAQIFTIHAFCARMLHDNVFEGCVGFGIDEENTLSDAQIVTVIRDFFRTELTYDCFSPAQLKIISSEYLNFTEKLEHAILKALQQGREIKEYACYSSLLQQFRDCMQQLTSTSAFSTEKILADFIKQAPCYEKLCDRQQQVKQENIEIVQAFAALFEQKEWSADDFDRLLLDGIFVCSALDPSKLKAKKSPPSSTDLHYPYFIPQLREQLLPIVEEANSPSYILARMTYGCQQMLKKTMSEEEKLGFDDILKTMLQALQNPLFAQRIRNTYQVGIVDEFQDTDPVQWEIFRHLFLAEGLDWGHLYLVGDPKQSIYAFRQADVYTYLSAAQLLGEDHHASLDTNFRSQPSLVAALNLLFSPENSPGLFALQRVGKFLNYRQVNACRTVPEKAFSDSIGSIHFSLVPKEASARKLLPLEKLEEHFYLPFYANEIHRLHRCDGMRFKQFAFLVKDRFQAQRIAAFLKAHHIPTTLQRSTSLTESPVLPAMRELVQAVLHPKKDALLKVALGGPILGWNCHDIRSLEQEDILARVLIQFYALRKSLLSESFASFFQRLLEGCWHEDRLTVSQRLLAQQDGIDLYQDLHQIAHLAIEQEQLQGSSSEGWLDFFDHFDSHAEDQLKKYANTTQDSVNILTLHSSKGLEFDVVIAIGLAARTQPPEQLLPLECGRLGVVLDKEAQIYQQHCREIDAEKIRQLYVAMTRAKYRLYLPVSLAPENDAPDLGCASPMELFLARLGQPETKNDTLYERIAGYDGTILCGFIEAAASQCKITYSHLLRQEDNAATSPARYPNLGADLSAPPRIYIPEQRLCMHSFTSLAKTAPFHAQPMVLSMPHDYDAMVKTPHSLPCGSKTGNLLHLILQTIPFQIGESLNHSEQLSLFVRPQLRGTHFSAWELVISQMIFNALTVPLTVGDCRFTLSEIPAHQRFHEIEFLYPSTGLPEVEEMKSSPGFLKGFIDLIIAHQGKYYLIDWKSNWLGTTVHHYSPVQLRTAMHEHDYLLQASIYTAALQRYLQVVDRRPFNEIFGGVFYLFLRGLDGSGNGVFHIV